MSDLDNLIADLEKAAGPWLERQVEQIVSKGCLNIKTDWRRAWTGHPHIAHLPRGIGYDLESDATGTRGTVGVDEENIQAELAHIIELGGVRSAPLPAGQKALDDEEPRLVRALEALSGRAISG